MKRAASSTAGTTAADAIDLDAVTELTYSRLHAEGRRRSSTSSPGETAAQRLERIVHTNRDFTAEDYEALLLLDRHDGAANGVRAEPCTDIVLHAAAETQLPGAADCAACAVCLDALAPGARVWQLPRCGHVFHARCIARWFDECQAHPVCPICRAPHPVVNVAAAVESSASPVPPAKKRRNSGHHGARKHERKRGPAALRPQRSAHNGSWVELAPHVHASFGPQTTLHAKFHALGKANAPVEHILPKSETKPEVSETTTNAAQHSSYSTPSSSTVPEVVIID